MSQVNVWLLGTPRIERANQPVSFGTRKATALVAYLAVTGQTHRRDALVTLLWPDYDQQQGAQALRTTLWTARKHLGDDALVITRQQVALDTSGGIWIDVQAFDEAAGNGLAGDWPPPAAIDFLEKAVALYQGDLMAGFSLKDSLEFDEWQLLEAQHLRQQFGRVLAALVDAHIAQGNITQALTVAQRQVSFDQLDEIAHQNVMRLYAQTGQRAAALRQYDTCARILNRQMGITPSEETQQLRQAIETEELHPTRTPDAVAPHSSAPARRGDTGPLRAGDLQARLYDRAELVLQRPRRLIGRDALIGTVNRLLDDGETVLLHGMGGFGKTSLAATVAAGRITATGQPVIWLEMGHAGADTVFEALARVFGQESAIARQTGDERIMAIRDLLLDHPALLVLDNAWNDRALFQVIKAVPPGMPVIITSRERLPVGPILDVTELAPDDALALLSHHAYRTFDPRDHDALTVCRWLGFHPFALEIAGKTLNVDDLTPVELMDRVGSSPHRMTTPRSFADEGRESVKNLLDASIATLDNPALDVLLAFGALWTTTATPNLLALCLDEPPESVAARLAELVQHGLAERSAATGDNLAVFRVHDLTYSYARANAPLSDATVIDACRAYAAQHMHSLDALDAEIGNLLGAARAADRIARPDQLVAIMHLLAVDAKYGDARGYGADLLDLLNRAALAAEDSEQIEAAHYLYGKLGDAYRKYIEQFDRAFAFYDRSFLLAQRLGDRGREALLLAMIGTNRFQQGADDPDLYYERAYQLAKTHQAQHALASILNHRSAYEGQKAPPDFERSWTFSNESVELARRLEKHDSLFNSLINRGNCERLLGQYDTALTTHEEALELAEHHQNHLWQASAFWSLGEDWHGLNNRAQAQLCFDRTLTLWIATGVIARARHLVDFMRDNGYTVDHVIP